MEQRIYRRRRFKIPKNICSRNNEHESPVCFKNLTEDTVHLYWIDYNGKPCLYAILNPVNRTEEGYCVKSYASHPWVAIVGKTQLLLNGKRYFHPPHPHSWKQKHGGWLNSKWNSIDQENSNLDENDNKFFEVLIESPGCRSLKDLSLLQCCQLYSRSETVQLKLPKQLKLELEMIRRRFFWW